MRKKLFTTVAVAATLLAICPKSALADIILKETETAAFCPVLNNPDTWVGVSHFVNDHLHRGLVWTGSTPGDGSAASLVITGNNLPAGKWQMQVQTSGGSKWFVVTTLRLPGNLIAITDLPTSVVTQNGISTVTFDAQAQGFPVGSQFVTINFADFGNGSAFTDKVFNVTVAGHAAVPNLFNGSPIVYCPSEVPK